MNREYYIKKYLTNDIRLNTEDDEQDSPIGFGDFSEWPPRKYTSCIKDNYGLDILGEFSDCNQYSLLSEFMKVRDKAKVILEIGVARLSTNFYEHTSTTVLLNNKKEDTIYIGIDIDDKSFLEKEGKNIHTIQSSSENYSLIKEKLEKLGITQIDFLFIDGWHSINQVIDELFYVDLLSTGGIVGYHDTNFHPGPSKIIEALNPDVFQVRKHCTLPTDYGISFATRK